MAFERDPKKLFPHDRLLARTIVPLVPLFVTPNHVTIFRLLFTPLVLWFLYVGQYTLAIPLFVLLAFSDALDGTLARLRHQITPWGTFYDPVADKLLVGSIVLLIVAREISLPFALLIIGIECAIILGGVHRRRRGKLHGANIFGKTKMLLQVIAITLLLLSVWLAAPALIPWSVGVLVIATIFAVFSLLTYGL